jgi:hypothetical protein
MILLDVYAALSPNFFKAPIVIAVIVIALFLIKPMAKWVTKNDDPEDNPHHYADPHVEPHKVSVSELNVPCMLYVYEKKSLDGEPFVSYIDNGRDNLNEPFILNDYIGPKLIAKRQYHVDTTRTFRAS